jgi:hypothetical protein
MLSGISGGWQGTAGIYELARLLMTPLGRKSGGLCASGFVVSHIPQKDHEIPGNRRLVASLGENHEKGFRFGRHRW